MARQKLTDEEREAKRQLNNDRQYAVRHAWKEEQIRVANGEGTRNWTKEEQKELLETGRVAGYEGHHMKSASLYPEQARNPENIQFLTEEEHLYGAHQGNYHNQTNGYYNPETGTMTEFSGDELIQPTVTLDDPYINFEELRNYDEMATYDDQDEQNDAELYMGDAAQQNISSEASEGMENSSSAENTNEME